MASPELAQRVCPDDESDEDGNSIGCEALHTLDAKVLDLAQAHRESAEKEGQILNEMRRCRKASELACASVARSERLITEVRDAAAETKDYAKSVIQAVNLPINNLIETYQKRVSEHPAAEELSAAIEEFPMSESTQLDIKSPRRSYERIRQSERERKRAEEKAEAAAEQAQRERIRLEAEKIVAEKEAKQLAEKKKQSDRMYKMWIAILATVAAIATFGAGAIGLASKMLTH